MPVRLDETYSQTVPVYSRKTRIACLWRVAVVTRPRLVRRRAVLMGAAQATPRGRLGQIPRNHPTVTGWDWLLPSESVLISDGGLATELEARGHDLSDPLWSARLLAEAPQEIVAVHAAYFRAGAVIATTAQLPGVVRRLRSPRDRPQRRRRIAAPQRRTRQRPRGTKPARGTRCVAASIGPYGAALADGSEYRGRYGLSVAALAAVASAPPGNPGRRRRGRAGPAKRCPMSTRPRRW